MRIQHNIMAMNAYRNYNNNTSALSKNLEKLSSGYRINRAGDDAAGLAISEKMRAQITGLDAAQKNVKDGISLVKTAEGAMQEIQDMLNRMDYLATQSANGTYDNEVDRAALQKEVEQLKSEINRIADSANFNGIKLLDGSLDASKVATDAVTETNTVNPTESEALTVANGKLPEVGQVLGGNTVLHVDGSQATPTATTMSLDFHNLSIDGLKGQTFTLQVGDTKLTGTLAEDGEVTGADIAAALAGTGTAVTFTDADGEDYYSTAAKFGDGVFTAAPGTAGSSRVTFTQTNDVDFDPEMTVSVTVGSESAVPIAKSVTTDGADAIPGFSAGTKAAGTAATGTTSDWQTGTAKLAAGDTDKIAAMNTLSVGGHTVDLSGVADDFTDGDTTVSAAITAIQNAIKTQIAASNETKAGGTTTYNEIDVDSITVTGTATGFSVAFQQTPQTYSLTNTPATAATTVIDFAGKTGADVIGGKLEVGAGKYEFVKSADDPVTTGYTAVVIAENATSAQIAAALQGVAAPTGTTATVAGAKVTYTTAATGEGSKDDVATTVGKSGGDPKMTGDYNVSTTNIAKKGVPASERLASTYFDLTKDMAANGSTITIGLEDFTFTTDKADKGTAGKIYVGDLDLSKAEDLVTAADRLTEAAKANTTYTVGHDGSRMTFTEIKNQGNFDLTELEGVEESFNFRGVAYEDTKVTSEATEGGKALTLQIGDTADDYNQLKVSVGDMHVSAMGIADIDIGTQDGAAAAVQTIKDAINYVSGVRGDLGAIQNRLEHTQNNLSVMAENIQDAESTIRDTDVASEMMSYVKNNILVQSAQAMLAQANQVPQGVLQLLG